MEVTDDGEEEINPFSFECFVKRHSTADAQESPEMAKSKLAKSSNCNQQKEQSEVNLEVDANDLPSSVTDSDSRSEDEERNPFSYEKFVKKDRRHGVYIFEKLQTSERNELVESQNRQQPPSQQPPVLPEKESSKGHHGTNGGSKQNSAQQQAEIIDFLYDVPPSRKTEDGESQRSNKSNTAGRKCELDAGCEDYAVPKGPVHQDYAVPRTTRSTSHSHGSGSKGHKSDKHGSRARSNTAREDRKVNRKSKANTTHHDKHQNDKQSDTDNPPEYDDGDIHVSIEDILSETSGNGPHDVRRKTFTGIRPSEQKSNHKENGGVSSEVQRLKHENAKLKKDLQDNKRHEKDSKKMREMESEIRRLKQREAEDAKALETMVQHVEDNLRRTTDRAVAAENHVTKLKQEMKHLKSHIHHMQLEPKPPPVVDESNGDLGAIRLKAQATSLKLASLSREAEQQLKQLLGGVEALKVVAETLACIDKVVEDTDSRHSTAL